MCSSTFGARFHKINIWFQSKCLLRHVSCSLCRRIIHYIIICGEAGCEAVVDMPFKPYKWLYFLSLFSTHAINICICGVSCVVLSVDVRTVEAVKASCFVDVRSILKDCSAAASANDSVNRKRNTKKNVRKRNCKRTRIRLTAMALGSVSLSWA